MQALCDAEFMFGVKLVSGVIAETGQIEVEVVFNFGGVVKAMKFLCANPMHMSSSCSV